MQLDKNQIFRFQRNQEHIIDTIKNKHLYFSNYDDLNDPLDCRFPLLLAKSSGDERVWEDFMYYMAKFQYKESSEREWIKHAKAAINKGLHQNDIWLAGATSSINEREPEKAICCFSKNLQNMVMWAHYADNHKGVVLCFDRDQIFATEDGQKIMFDVEYRSAVLGVNDFVDAIKNCLYGTDMNAWVRKRLCTKSIHWEYEKEVRFICDKKNCFLPFKEAALSGIIFGYKCPSSFVRKIICALSAWEHKPALYQSSVDYSSTELKIDSLR